MIPKKIHYCWLSGKKMPVNIKKCIETWYKVLYDYEFILWDKNKFDINSVPFVKQAYNAGKWAFASDYIRLYAIYNEGGIYLDTDVYVLKSFNSFLHYDFFSSLERNLSTIPPNSEYAKYFKLNINTSYFNDVKRIDGFGLQAAIFGANSGNVFLKDCMNWYQTNDFLLPNNESILSTGLVAPDIYASIAQKYGFKYISGIQKLTNNMIIFPAEYFPNHIYKTDNAYAVHLCENSWSQNNIPNIKNVLLKNKYIKFLLRRDSKDWEYLIKIGGESKLI